MSGVLCPVASQAAAWGLGELCCLGTRSLPLEKVLLLRRMQESSTRTTQTDWTWNQAAPGPAAGTWPIGARPDPGDRRKAPAEATADAPCPDTAHVPREQAQRVLLSTQGSPLALGGGVRSAEGPPCAIAPLSLALART